MTKEDFKISLKKALDGLIVFTQEMVVNKLPLNYKFIIKTKLILCFRFLVHLVDYRKSQ